MHPTDHLGEDLASEIPKDNLLRRNQYAFFFFFFEEQVYLTTHWGSEDLSFEEVKCEASEWLFISE